MAVSCDSASLVQAAKCFECVPGEAKDMVLLYLWAQIAAATAGTSTDPATLVKNAKCFSCVPGEAKAEVRLYLLCQIATASGA